MSRSCKDAMKGSELQEVVFTATQLKKIAFNVLKSDKECPLFALLRGLVACARFSSYGAGGRRFNQHSQIPDRGGCIVPSHRNGFRP
jgi:hypothetical protein